MQWRDKKKIVLIGAGATVLLLVLVIWSFLVRNGDAPPVDIDSEPETLTPQEQIRRALSVPSNKPPATEEEKRQIRDALQQPVR